jgi:diketogulonate reductase-like aldo/keto reductase
MDVRHSTEIPRRELLQKQSHCARDPETSKEEGCTTAQIALAWVASQGLIAIPGTTRIERLQENWASREVQLSEEEREEMRRIIDGAKVWGVRYGAEHQGLVGH